MVELTFSNISQSIDDNTLRVVDSDDLRCTIRCTAVVDETRNATHFRSIDDRIFVNTEQVAGTYTLHVVFGFAQICDEIPPAAVDRGDAVPRRSE